MLMQRQGQDGTGYASPEYAESLREFGVPVKLERCGGWILNRAIPNSFSRDAMGCYPLFACRDWSQLARDLDDFAADLVTCTVVADPFGAYDPALLKETFPDRFAPFKQHFVADLKESPTAFVARHHLRNARAALRRVNVERCQDPAEFLDDWIKLYSELITRHRLAGIPAFSSASFAKQFQVPGLVAFRAVQDAVTVGMTLWYVLGSVGYYHLGAYSCAGYDLGASFALFMEALNYFSNQLQWLNLGAGAGVTNDSSDGLSRFKRGWATGTRTAYLCGRIFDRDKYQQLADDAGLESSDYFPAYRFGEFSLVLANSK